MLFDRLHLTLNLKNSFVELSTFKAECGGAANVSIFSLCNETNVTLSDSQKSFFDGLVLSAFNNEHAEKYDAALYASIDPTVSHLSLADVGEVRRFSQNSRVPDIASNTLSIPVIVSSFAAVLVTLALVLVAFKKYRSKSNAKKEVRPKSNSHDHGFQPNELRESTSLPCGGIMFM